MWCPVWESQLPWRSYAIRLIKSKMPANLLISYALSIVAWPAATAAVSRSRGFPLSADSFLKAVSSSWQRIVKSCLSPGGELPRFPGYSQSRSSPSKLYCLNKLNKERESAEKSENKSKQTEASGRKILCPWNRTGLLFQLKLRPNQLNIAFGCLLLSSKFKNTVFQNS